MKKIFFVSIVILLVIGMVSCGAKMTMEGVVEKLENYANTYENFSYTEYYALETVEEVFEEAEEKTKKAIKAFRVDYQGDYECLVAEFESKADAKAFVEAAKKEVDGFKWTDEYQDGDCVSKGCIAVMGSEILIEMILGEK